MKLEFIRIGDKYMIKNSQSKIIDEKEKLELEKKGLILEDITGKDCQEKTTKKIKKINKRLKDLESGTDVQSVEETN